MKPDPNSLSFIMIADSHQSSSNHTLENTPTSSVNECAEKMKLEPEIIARSRFLERGLTIEGRKIMADLELLEGTLKPAIRELVESFKM